MPFRVTLMLLSWREFMFWRKEVRALGPEGRVVFVGREGRGVVQSWTRIETRGFYGIRMVEGNTRRMGEVLG